MPSSFDPSSDFPSVADGLEPITLVRPGSSLSVEIADALRRPALRRETVDSDGRHMMADVVWHLPVSSLPGPPRPGDVIHEGDVRWTVLGVRPATLASRWYCLSRNLVVAHGLNDYVDLEKAVVGKTESGTEHLTWQPWRSGLPAKIQPAGTTLHSEDERLHRHVRFKIYLLEDIEIDTNCRARSADGTIYRVVGSHRTRRLDELMYLEAEQES